jgi:hypothetical protein
MPSMERNWIEKSLHPVLRLQIESVEVTYRRLSLDCYTRESASFKVECAISHSRGKLIYQEDDLWFFLVDFAEFARGLKKVFQGSSPEISLGSMSRDLVVTIRRDSTLRIMISVCLPQIDGPNITASADLSVWNCALLDRWIEELDSFLLHLEEWRLMQD